MSGSEANPYDNNQVEITPAGLQGTDPVSGMNFTTGLNLSGPTVPAFAPATAAQSWGAGAALAGVALGVATTNAVTTITSLAVGAPDFLAVGAGLLGSAVTSPGSMPGTALDVADMQHGMTMGADAMAQADRGSAMASATDFGDRGFDFGAVA